MGFMVSLIVFSDPLTIFGLFLLIIVILILLAGIRIIKEWERIPVLRLGRFVGVRGPGVQYVIPLFERVPRMISTRIMTIAFKTEQTLTLDNVPVNVDAVMYSKVVDVQKAILNVEDYSTAIQWAAQTTLREVIGKIDLNELLAEREKVGGRLREIIDEKTEAWGIKVTAVEVKDVIIPTILQDAMSRQAQAERERMARVTLATAEFQAAQKMIDAADLYEKNPKALGLRWMNILYEIGQQEGTNTIMLIPSTMPEAGFSPVGVYGLKKIREDKKEQLQKTSEEK
jgi:regulator of protease activity HflC (stomatin/prohibitin superfamily)